MEEIKPMIVPKILIADDARIIRTVLSRKLEEAGYAVIAVQNGREALEVISRESFDLAILDIHMPELNGLETVREIRKTYSATQLPVIMATANGEDDHVIESFEAGANDYVTKPINFPVLQARMGTHLMLKQALEELERERRAHQG